MNERLKELARKCGSEGMRQVGGYVDDDETGDSVWIEQMKLDSDGVDLEKFAELIVRECAKHADNVPGEYLMQPHKYPSTYIKEQFGVEE